MAEILVVVAIIAVLVAVAIPIFAANQDEAKEAVCAANRRSLKGLLSSTYLLEGTEESVEAAYKDNIKNYTCPFKGTITYTLKDDIITVTCSHLDKNNSFSDKDKLSNIFPSLEAYNLAKMQALYNSGNASKEQLEIIKKAFEAAGLNIDNMKNWALRWRSNDGYSKLYWSDEDFANDTGTKYVLAYSVKGNYTVWEMNVVNGVITGEGKQITPANEPNQTYEKALELYNKKINEKQ